MPPHGAWDSHVHVLDEDRFPLHAHHAFRPRKATIRSLQAFHDRLGIKHACLVAFSPYHTDNRCLLDALSQVGEQARGVACIDPFTISDEGLEALHQAGVRAVRLNLRTRSEAFDSAVVKATANRVRHLDWVLQIYLALDQVVDLAPLVPQLGVTIVIDHIGAPHADGGPVKLQAGYSEFMNLLKSGLVWTKLSGLYRFPDLPDLEDYVLEILHTAPDHVVWASDWPHSGGAAANPGGDRDQLQEYREIDDQAWVAQCWEWCRRATGCNGEELARKIWVDNPQVLWRVERS